MGGRRYRCDAGHEVRARRSVERKFRGQVDMQGYREVRG
jgi:hypothetical protein